MTQNNLISKRNEGITVKYCAPCDKRTIQDCFLEETDAGNSLYSVCRICKNKI